MKRLVLLVLLLAACAPRTPTPPPTPPTPPTPQSLVEQTLRAVAAGAEIPADLAVTYSDMHGLWGGTTITVSGTGAYEWQRVDRQRESERIQGSITPEQLRGLVALLVELRAWEQVTPDRRPVPDESRAGLILRAGGGEARMWEWYNDMPTGARLARIRDRMSELRAGLPSDRVPVPPVPQVPGTRGAGDGSR